MSGASVSRLHVDGTVDEYLFVFGGIDSLGGVFTSDVMRWKSIIFVICSRRR